MWGLGGRGQKLLISEMQSLRFMHWIYHFKFSVIALEKVKIL